MKTLTTIKPAGLAKIALYGLLLIGVYYSSLLFMVSQWQREDYSYCYLMPFVVFYLIWEKRNRLTSQSSIPSWWGMLFFGAGIVLFWFGELGGEYLTLYISLWLIIAGLSWVHLGWEKLKNIGFALILILTMFPLPSFLYNKVSVKLKLISSWLGVAMMQLYGMSAYSEGNVIDLGFTQLQVVDACSGLRYLIPLIVLGILLAYFFQTLLWKRAVLVVSTIPVAIISNSLRIALTGILYEVWGARVAEGFFHWFSGWFIFIFSLAVLLLEMWALIGFRSLRSLGASNGELVESANRGMVDLSTNSTNQPINQSTWLKALFSPSQFIVAIIILGATLAFSQSIEFREKIPIKRSFDRFSLKAGEWSGTRQFMEQRFIDTLDLSDYIIIEYNDKFGRSINLYVAYYESQRKGESIHSPATCLPGTGWIFNQAGSVNIPLPTGDGKFMKVNRAFMQKGAYKQLSYYWFPQRGRILTNAYQLKIYAFWDALTKQRTDGALVRLITPVYKYEELKDADARLQEFTRKIVPMLGEFIPGK